MARFRKVPPRLWNDTVFRELSSPQANAQSLLIYLLTGPHTTRLPGLFVAGEAGLAEALGWPLKAFQKAFAELFKKGLAKADWEARVVLVPMALSDNPPENPNVLKGWLSELDEIPDCNLKNQYLCRLKAFIEGLSKAFQEVLDKRFPKGLAKQEQEQEQEQEQKRREAPPDGAASPSLFSGPKKSPPKKTRTPPELTAAAEDLYTHCVDSDAFEVPHAETTSGRKIKTRTLNSIIDRLTEEGRAARKKNPDLSEPEALKQTAERFRTATDDYIAEYRRRRQGRPDAWRYKLTNFWGQKAHWTYHDPEGKPARASPGPEHFPVGKGAINLG